MHRLLQTTLLLLLVHFLPVFSQTDREKVELRLTQVEGSVYMLEGAGGNIAFLARPEGVLMVDAQFAPLIPRIRQKLLTLPGEGRIRFLVNTHWHSDHTSGNQALGPDVPVVAHENVRKLLTRETFAFGENVPPAPESAWPTVTFRDSLDLFLGKEAVHLEHIPDSHTNGDVIVFFPGNHVVHLGDLLFTGGFPYLDYSNGGNATRWANQLEAILKRIPQDARVIPGHGPLATTEDVRAFRNMLLDTEAIVKKGMSEGKTLKQLQSAGFPDRYKGWDRYIPAETWVEFLYRSLGGKE